MAANDNSLEYTRTQQPIPDCDEPDNATQKKINAVKKIYCDELQTEDSSIRGLAHVYRSNEHLYKQKELRFLFTQDNFQRYINTEISFGSQLLQANERIKGNVASYKAWDDDLATNLKSIFLSVKDLKAKIGDLRDAASKIDNSRHDSCNSSQWCILTGKTPDNCKDDTKPKPPIQTEGCHDIEENLDDIVYMPKTLAQDVDFLFKSSADIIGIQKFCNLISLVSLEDVLYTKAKDFDGLLQDTITKRKPELDSRQKELTDSLKQRTNSVMDLYSQRCNYSATHKTLEEICCPICGCVELNPDNYEPRLEHCQCEICDICKEVRNTFIEQEIIPQLPATN